MKIPGSVALITGGAQGLGKAFATALLQRGGKVAVLDVNKKKGEEFLSSVRTSHNPEHSIFIHCDVTNEEEMNGAFNAARKNFGQLNIICNNAGIMDAEPDNYKQVIALNLAAVIHGTQEGINLLRGGKGGVIVNVASMAGIYPLRGGAIYSATKFGVVGYSRSFKKTLLKDQIRVNCLCPSFATQMFEECHETLGHNFQKLVERVGIVPIDLITQGFLQLVENDSLNGDVLGVTKDEGVFLVDYSDPSSPKHVPN